MNESEKINKKLLKWLKDNNLELNDENLAKFFELHNSHALDKEDKDNEEISDELFDKAMETEDYDERISLLEEALEYNPDNLDAYVSYVYLTSRDDALNKLIKKEKEYAKKHFSKKFIEENKGEFYYILETRPYLRLLFNIGEEYINSDDYENGVKTFEKIIELNNNDNMGVRYRLSGLYLFLERFEEFNNLWDHYKKDSSSMKIADLYLYNVLNKDKRNANKYLKLLYKSNFFTYLSLSALYLPHADDSPSRFAPGSVEETMVYIEEHHELIFDLMNKDVLKIKEVDTDIIFNGSIELFYLNFALASNPEKFYNKKFSKSEIAKEMNSPDKKIILETFNLKKFSHEDIDKLLDIAIKENFLIKADENRFMITEKFNGVVLILSDIFNDEREENSSDNNLA